MPLAWECADAVASLRDSLLEGDGFEPSVPQQICSRFRDISPVSHDGLATRNRKFESISSISESDANMIPEPWGLRVAAQGAAGPPILSMK